MMGPTVYLYTWDERSNRVLYLFFFFPYIYLYMYNMRCFSTVEKRNARRRTSSPRPSKEFANREGDTAVERERRKGRDATSMIPRVIIIMRIIHVCVFIYNIYFH